MLRLVGGEIRKVPALVVIRRGAAFLELFMATFLNLHRVADLGGSKPAREREADDKTNDEAGGLHGLLQFS